jgi:hypothetical protein
MNAQYIAKTTSFVQFNADQWPTQSIPSKERLGRMEEREEDGQAYAEQERKQQYEEG